MGKKSELAQPHRTGLRHFAKQELLETTKFIIRAPFRGPISGAVTAAITWFTTRLVPALPLWTRIALTVLGTLVGVCGVGAYYLRKRWLAHLASEIERQVTPTLQQVMTEALLPSVDDVKLMPLLTSQSSSQRLAAFTVIAERLETDPHSLGSLVATALAEIARSKVPGPDIRETAIELLRRGGYHRKVMTDGLLEEWLTDRDPPESFRACMCRLIENRDTLVRLLAFIEPQPAVRFFDLAISEMFAAVAELMADPRGVITSEDRERAVAQAAEFRQQAFTARFAPQHYVEISFVSAEFYLATETNKYRCEVVLELDSRQEVEVDDVELQVYYRDSSVSFSRLGALTVNGKHTHRFAFDLWSEDMTGKSRVFLKNKYLWHTDYFWPRSREREVLP